jgi:hypothetical protein
MTVQQELGGSMLIEAGSALHARPRNSWRLTRSRTHRRRGPQLHRLRHDWRRAAGQRDVPAECQVRSPRVPLRRASGHRPPIRHERAVRSAVRKGSPLPVDRPAWADCRRIPRERHSHAAQRLPLVVRGANNGGTADRPNVVGDPELSGDERSLTRWFNTSAFTAPPPFTFGTAPRVLSRPRGPGFASVDLVVARTLTFSATSNVQLRAEFFNLFNRVNFNQPNTNFLSGEFGQIVSAGEGRRVQFGAKLYF